MIKRMFSDNKTSFTLIHSGSRLPLIDSAEKIREYEIYIFSELDVQKSLYID